MVVENSNDYTANKKKLKESNSERRKESKREKIPQMKDNSPFISYMKLQFKNHGIKIAELIVISIIFQSTEIRTQTIQLIH